MIRIEIGIEVNEKRWENHAKYIPDVEFVLSHIFPVGESITS